MPRHVVVFILVASFGILFVGCGQPNVDDTFEEFTFTDNDLQRVEEIVTGTTGSSAVLTVASSSLASTTLDGTTPTAVTASGSAVVTTATGTPATGTVKTDPEKQRAYDALRVSLADQSGNTYRVNNPFLNVRAAMEVSSTQIAALKQGESMVVLDIPNGEWAKVRLSDGKEGYVALRYIAKMTTEQRLPEDKKEFEGKYYVDYAFVNLRKEPSSQAEKIGEIPGQAIVKPIAINGEWARVAYQGKEGYVSTTYLQPLQPVFLVRQDDYTLPIVQFRVTDAASITALGKDVAALKAAGKKIVQLKSLFDLVQLQETRDARPTPNTVVLVVTGVNASNVRQVGDALQASAVGATLFISTKDLGIAGITQKTILNLMANGNEILPEGHTGDDLRSLTDSQVALELSQSKQLLEELTGKEAYAVAYPIGGVNDRVMKTASQMGYLFGLTQTPDTRFTRSQFLRLPTLYVTGATAPEEVAKMVK